MYSRCLYSFELMGALTQDQLDDIWNRAGLKHRIGRFRNWLVERGLSTHVNSVKIQKHFYEVLSAFLVIGVEETLDGKQSIPQSSGTTVNDADPKGEAK
jgi:hypothetical protein